MTANLNPVLDNPVRSADRFTTVPSPIGELLLTGNGEQLLSLGFPPHGAEPKPWDLAGLRPDRAAFESVAAQLTEYFAGRRERFDVPLAPVGSGFNLRVWRALLGIGYGKTCSYGSIAEQLGVPGAARAVGAANHANPIPIIIPCHRVIGADGSMTGFGGGLAVKHFLLGLEAQTLF